MKEKQIEARICLESMMPAPIAVVLSAVIMISDAAAIAVKR